MNRPCLECGKLGAWGSTGRCDTHRKQRQRRKDAQPARRRQKAKYDNAHAQLRAYYTPMVNAGTVHCWRCGLPIAAGSVWHLGHRKGRPSAPEHVACNLAHSNERKA